MLRGVEVVQNPYTFTSTCNIFPLHKHQEFQVSPYGKNRANFSVFHTFPLKVLGVTRVNLQVNLFSWPCVTVAAFVHSRRHEVIITCYVEYFLEGSYSHCLSFIFLLLKSDHILHLICKNL